MNKGREKGISRFAASIAGALLLLVVPGSAQAASITVTTPLVDEAMTDNGNCTLREAVQAANTNATVDVCVHGGGTALDTISIPAGTVTLAGAAADDLNAGGDLDVTVGAASGPLTIQGAGAASTTIDGNDLDRVIHLVDSISTNALTIQDLTIRDGNPPSTDPGGGISNGAGITNLHLESAAVTSNESDGPGGGLFVLGSSGTSVTINDSTISDNSTSHPDGGGGLRLSVVPGPGTLTVTDSTISGNDATDTSNAGKAAGLALIGLPLTATLSGTTVSGNDNSSIDGGGISLNNNTSLTVQDGSRISGNFVRDLGATGGEVGGNARGGGIFSIPGTNTTLTVRDSEVSGNSASAGGGGGIELNTTNATNHLLLDRATVSGNTAGGGGGIVGGGTVELVNSTVSGNTASEPDDGEGGGIFVFNASSLELRHSTVADNLGSGLVGIDSDAIFLFGTATFEAGASIVADDASDGNTTDACGGIPNGIVDTNHGFNIDDGTSCGFGTTTGNQSSTDAQLGPLGFYGGPTQTRELLPSSPAVNIVPPTDCDDLTGTTMLTQDQRGFVRPFETNCDAGSYELNEVCLGRGVTVVSTAGADSLTGTAGGDAISGGAGNDTIDGAGGDDRLCGDSDNDMITGGGGADQLLGGLDDDGLFARDAIADMVDCDLGADTAQTDQLSLDSVTGCETLDALPEPPPVISPTISPTPVIAPNPHCATLRKKLKAAKKRGDTAKVRKIRGKLRRLGC
jgi:CSLREA domain-containing protein